MFAPSAAPFDNVPTVSRQMSTWVTSDGLTWRQEWWGEMPLEGAEASTSGAPQNYGANNFCTSEHRSGSLSCLATGSSFGDDPSATMLAHMRPYEAT